MMVNLLGHLIPEPLVSILPLRVPRRSKYPKNGVLGPKGFQYLSPTSWVLGPLRIDTTKPAEQASLSGPTNRSRHPDIFGVFFALPRFSETVSGDS